MVASVAGPLLALVLLAVLVGVRGDELAAALAAVPLVALAGAVALHVLTLGLRAEAWRTALAAVDGRRQSRRGVHAASAGAFTAGAVISHATMPVRVALLRRSSPAGAPRAGEIAVVEAPILAMELACAFALIAVAMGTAPGVPWWAAPAGLVATAALMVALRLVHGRFGHRPLIGGLSVLAARRRRVALLALMSGVTLATATRVWLVLIAFSLPHGAADVATLFAAMALAGLLPIGPAAGPAAALAVVGGGDVVSVAAAGLLISASSALGVIAYGALVVALMGGVAATRRAVPARRYVSAGSALAMIRRSDRHAHPTRTRGAA